jgi:CheY-like chemotaxis protein
MAVTPDSPVILVVDDEPQICAITSEMLRNLGYRTLQAYNAAEALETYKRVAGEICMVLTDVVMPSMNGQELADRLLEIDPDLKIVFMSGYTNGALRECDHVSVEEVRFLRKPFNQETLAQTVNS